MATMTEWPHWREWLKPGIHPQSCAETGHWIILPWKFNFLQLVPNTSQRHRAQHLLKGHSDIKEKKGNAGKRVLTVMFKEMTGEKKAHPPVCYAFLDSESNSLSFCITCAKVFFIQPWNIHDGEFSGGQAETASGSFSHLEWTGIWQLIVLILASLQSAKSNKKNSALKPSSLEK